MSAYDLQDSILQNNYSCMRLAFMVFFEQMMLCGTEARSALQSGQCEGFAL